MSSKSGPKNGRRKRWLFERQGGVCYLMTHIQCKARNGKMRLSGRQKRDWASIEHVIARMHKRRGDPHYILLACCDCNGMKGASEPTDAALDLAIRLHHEWIAHAAAVSLERNAPKHPRVGDMRSTPPTR